MDKIDIISELIYASILHEGDEQSDNDRTMPRLVGIDRIGCDLIVRLTSGLAFRVIEERS